jgi:hypothetical protein
MFLAVGPHNLTTAHFAQPSLISFNNSIGEVSRADRDVEDIILFNLGYSQHVFNDLDDSTRNIGCRWDEMERYTTEAAISTNQ